MSVHDQKYLCNIVYFRWSSATRIVKHPEDWSDQLAAETLALEPWRDGGWPYLL